MPGAASGCGSWSRAARTSGPACWCRTSTKQKGLAQAPDVTATVLSVVGLPVPDAVAGAPLTSDPAPRQLRAPAEARLTYLADYDEASHDVHDLVEPFFTVFAYGQLAIYLLVLLVYKGRLGSERTRVTTLSRVRVLSVAAASVPVSTFLANLLPWWRFPVDMISVVAAVGLFVAIIATAALRGPWGKWALGPMAFVSATTMIVLAVDVMTGSQAPAVVADGPAARRRRPLLRHGQPDLRAVRDGHHPAVHRGLVDARPGRAAEGGRGGGGR